MLLTSEKVNTIFMDCLFRDDEPQNNYIKAEGITNTIGFNPKRIKQHEKEIFDMLLCLPGPFMKSKGGGWSFLNACQDKDDKQWTGEHRYMQELFQLGIAIKKVRCLMPKKMWSIFPGGMPYYVIDDIG